MRVKICGITSYDDAIMAIDAGADALGFVFYEASPRYITPEKAAQICNKIPVFVERVGLFVHADSQTINTVCKDSSMSLAQIHWDAPKVLFDNVGVKTLKVVRAQGRRDVLNHTGEVCLVDSYVSSFGGAGERIDPSWFEKIDCSKMIIAGGLTPENVDTVLNIGAYGVDVSSGVERSKGVKDSMKVIEFIKKVKGKR